MEDPRIDYRYDQPEQLPGLHERRVEAIARAWDLIRNSGTWSAEGAAESIIAADLITGQQQCDSVQQTNEALLKKLVECAEVLAKVKIMIGATNESLNQAQRESNINQAWWMLDEQIKRLGGVS